MHKKPAFSGPGVAIFREFKGVLAVQLRPPAVRPTRLPTRACPPKRLEQPKPHSSIEARQGSMLDGTRTLLGAPGIALGARTLLGAPGRATRNKKPLETIFAY